MKVNKTLIIIFAYTVLTILTTYPLALKINTRLFGYKGDNMLYIHDIWVWSTQISGKKLNLGEIKYSKITTQPILDGTATLLAMATSPLVSYNILILFSFISGAFLTYKVAYRLTKNRLSSFLAGVIFSFSSFHIRQAQNHLEISQIEVIPFYFLFLLAFMNKKDKKSALLCGIALGAATLTVNYYGFFLGVLTGIIFIYDAIKNKHLPSTIKQYATLLLVAAVVTFIPNLKYINLTLKKADFDEITWKAIGKTDQDYMKYSARPWFYILPDIENPIFGRLSRKTLIEISRHKPYYLTKAFTANEDSLYLGIIPIILSLTALIYRRKKSKEFAALAIIFALISMPPFIFISLRKIYLPSFILMKLFPMFRVYARFGALTLFFISLTSAFGAMYITGKIKTPLYKFAFFSLSTILVLLEFSIYPKTEKMLPTPPEYSKDTLNDINVILEIPKLENHKNIFYQTYHHKPVYFVRITSSYKVDIKDLTSQLSKYPTPILIIFRGNFVQTYFDHKYNEIGLDLENPKRTKKSKESKIKHRIWLKENVNLIRNAGVIKELFNYDETYVFKYL